MSTPSSSHTSLNDYYRWHARIYDLTRWAFLFGRARIIALAASQMDPPARILEIGCGTGRNLAALARRFPLAQITGLDLSSDMLERAQCKVQAFGSRIGLLHRAYDAPVAMADKFDLIVLSYSLSMINPGFAEVLRICTSDLSPTGIIAVVDFHASRWSWFQRWMGVNHVRMEGHLLEELNQHFTGQVCQVQRAYGNLWQYLLFIGRAGSKGRQ